MPGIRYDSSYGGDTVLLSEANWTTPTKGFPVECAPDDDGEMNPVVCIAAYVREVEAELSEDIDTGLVGAIARIVSGWLSS